MAAETTSVAFYHATPIQHVPWILQEGLIPQWGPIARKQRENKQRVRFYTSAEQAKKAVAVGGDFRKLSEDVWGAGVELYVFRVLMDPAQAVMLAEIKEDMSAELLCRVPAENLVLLSTELEPVADQDLQAIIARYGPEACEPPTTFPPKCYELPF